MSVRGRAGFQRPGGLLLFAAVATVLCLLTAGLGLTGSGPSPGAGPSGPGAGSTSGGVVVAPAYVMAPGVVDAGPLPAAAPLDVEVTLAPSDAASLEATLALVSTPGTPEYRQFLTAQQVADRFAPSSDVYEGAVAYFEHLGLSVTTSPDRWSLLVSGGAGPMGAAFGTTFSEYREGGGWFYSHGTSARLPQGYPWAGALGLGNLSVARPYVAATSLGRVAQPPGLYTCPTSAPYDPCAVATAYNSSGLLASGKNGSGYRVAVVDVYDAAETQSQLASDLSSFTTAFGLPSGNVRYLYPVPTSRNLNQSYTQWGLEEALDLEWARASAPGATVEMTFAPDPTAGLYSAVDWLVAHQATDVISLSWGEPDVGIFNAFAGACSGGCNASSDGSYETLHPVLVAAALEGIGVFAASGDCGAAMGTSGVSTSYPASDPAVTGVGATDLTLTTSGAYSSEAGWSGNASGATSPGCINQGGSGGGWSPFPRPAWQNATGVPTTASRRGVPDVSIVGGSPVTIYFGGGATSVGGTSASCPIWAGLAAIADQEHAGDLGLLDPGLYALARSSLSSKVFHDVKHGNNGYAAGTGWDPVTGLGSPNAGALLSKLAAGPTSAPQPTVNLTVTPRSGSAPLAVTFHASVTGAPSPVASFDIDFGDYNATWTTGGWANWTYRYDGVFLARATVFLEDGNSSVSLPTPVQVGGARALDVSLNVSAGSVAAGGSVTFNASAVGGTGPYRYTFSFGDGTYDANTSQTSVAHTFLVTGSYCANVVAWDAASPADSGASLRVGVGVGGSAVPGCGNPTLLHATFSLPTAVALPGDLALNVTAAGGTPPYSVHFVSDDPYVTACQCGIFREVGRHTVWAFVNDSLLGSVELNTSILVTPPLVGWFNASALSGPAPLTLAFTGHAVGGDNGSASVANWSFGDGGSGTGASVSHTFAGPGLYVVSGEIVDAGGWTVSRLFVVDAEAPGASGALVVTATITPGAAAMFGALLTFDANATGGTPGYTYQWDLGNGGSAFGASAVETYGPPQCGATPCPLDVALNVTDAAGTRLSVSVPVPQPSTTARRWAALTLNESVGPTNGSTPLLVNGHATALGMPGPLVTWTYQAGAQSTGATGSYIYLTPGNYTLNVTASDALGDLVVHDHAVTVGGLARISPTVSAGPSPPAGIAPLDVVFSASASGGAGGPYAYAWSFGDGTVSASPVVAHVYATAGVYNASLVVTDAIGTPARLNWTVEAYAVSVVTLHLSATPGPIAPLGTYDVNVSASPSCGSYAVPTCGAGNVSATLYVGNRTAGPGSWAIPLPANGVGRWNLTLTAPRAAVGACTGACALVSLVAVATGPNYTGNASGSVSIAPSGNGGGTSGIPLQPWLVPVGLLAIGAVAVALVGLWSRRRRERGASPSRPREGPGAPPVA